MTQLERLLLTICLVESVALLLAIGALIELYRRHEKVVRDLLNRIMARTYADYERSAPVNERPLRNRPPLSDEELARREAQRKEAAARG